MMQGVKWFQRVLSIIMMFVVVFISIFFDGKISYAAQEIRSEAELEDALDGVEYDNAKESTAQSESPVVHEQSVMPSVLVNDNLSVKAIGHRLYLSNLDETSKNSDLTKPNGFYLFDGSKDFNTMEADMIITRVGASTSYGITAGIYVESSSVVSKFATMAFRGDKGIRNFYTKSTGSIGTGGINTTWNLDDKLHIKIKKNESKISFLVVTADGKEYTREEGYSGSNVTFGATDEARFGFSVSNADVVITNLVYKDANGNLLYDQNDCYEAVGEAPHVVSVETPVIADDRLSISVNWEGEDCQDDGAYKVELSADDGQTYHTLSEKITEKTYTASILESGIYRFRISGICGSQTSTAVVSNAAILQAPLEETTLQAESGDSTISLSWTQVEGARIYEIYRTTSDDNEYTLIDTTEMLTYEDRNLLNETLYYYYIVCKSDTNTSNGSAIVSIVPSAGHNGAYVYDEEAARITITNKTNDTVYTNKAVLNGVVEEAGTLELMVNDSIQDVKAVGANDSFSFEATLLEGRNEVELHLTDSKGNITRKIFNFVYLTNYNIIVDSAYTGVEGGELDSIKGVSVYRTVQAAVDSIPTANTQRVVILIKKGDYFEHLTVSSPYVTFIGEDRDTTRIYYCDETTVGGDTSVRCATYITKAAIGFSAENITFENSYKYRGTESNGSADAIRVDADQSTFVNVRFLGYQDTLQANSNKQYYYKCYITGNVDYIYGTDGQALFDDSELVFRYHAGKNSGIVTAPKTSLSLSYGYLFNNCRIVAEEGCSGTNYLLARPWGADASATFINCYMSSIINQTLPYADMSENLWKAARFREYYSYGEGFLINTNRQQLSSNEASKMLDMSFLGWDPYSTIITNATAYQGNIVTPVEEEPIEIEVTDLILDRNTLIFDTIGQTKTIKASVLPSEATEKTIEWTTSDAKVATVINGIVTAVGNGTATIKATAGAISATCKVTVSPKITAFTIDQTFITFDTIGTSRILKTTIVPSNAENTAVTWSSSDTKVATVSSGKITAVGNGTAIITAKVGSLTTSCNVVVSQKVTKVELRLKNQTINGTLKVQKGQSYSLKAMVTPTNADAKNANVTFSSSNKKRATVSSVGKVKVVGTGKVTITAKTADGKIAKVTLNATGKAIKVSKVKISGSKKMKVKEKQTLSLTISPATAKNQKVTWKSSNSKIATVNAKGVITAKKAGKVTITATTKDGSNKKTSIKITVKK